MSEAIGRPRDEFLERILKLERDVAVLKRLPSGLKSIGPAHLADNIPGSTLAASRIAATAAGLGVVSGLAADTDGAPAGLIRAGEESVFVVYNHQLGCWVSPAENVLRAASRNSATLKPIYASLSSGVATPADVLFPWREFDTAGLKPQFCVSGLGQGKSPFNISVAIVAQGANEDAATTTTTAEFAVANIKTGRKPKKRVKCAISGWADVPALTLADSMVITLRAKNKRRQQGQLCFGGYVRQRWVSK